MLNVISVAEAQALAKSAAKPVGRTRVLPLDRLPGRVAAAPVLCGEDIPAFRRSTMDGYAVICADTFGAGESSPAELTLVGEVLMGEETPLILLEGECAKIPTGGMLPANADGVIPVEYTDDDGMGTCLVFRSVSPWENVVRAGDDAARGTVLFETGERFTPVSVGILAAAGVTECLVYDKPRVGILSTGNEIVPACETPAPGRVRDVNAHLLSALCAGYGCEIRRYGIIPDREDALLDALKRAAEENDLVLLSGGSSAGDRDLTARTISALGEVLSHGIAMKPGKPTVIGRIGGTPVFGLPGHPAACCFVTETVVAPCVETLSGGALPISTTEAELSENISSNHGREEFICVKLQNGAAIPVYGKSGVVSQLSAADGYLRVPRNSEGLQAGSRVKIHLFRG